MNECGQKKCDYYRQANPGYRENQRCAMAPYKPVRFGHPNDCLNYKPEAGK